MWGIDVSRRALEVARRNAVFHGVLGRILLLEGDLLGPVLDCAGPCLDAVAANLPYVDEEDLKSLPPEVQKEPLLALNGGPGGLGVIRRFIPQAYGALKSRGQLFLEVGLFQAEAVAQEMAGAGFEVEVEKDLAGAERFAVGRKRGNPS